MTVTKEELYDQDIFCEYQGDGNPRCGDCVKGDLLATERGELTGDTAVTPDIITIMPEGHPYQCDGCMYQNPEYEEMDPGDELP